MRRIALALLCIPSVLLAGSLDDALVLVLQTHPGIAEKRLIADETAKKTDWEANIRLGYSYRATTTESLGPNASFIVTIPLFSRKRQIENAKARLVVSEQRDQIRKTFLAEYQTLKSLTNQRYAAEQRLELLKDKLKWYQQSVEEGRFEADLLWIHAEAAQTAELKARNTDQTFHTLLDTTARQFGGNDWMRLRALLAEAVKSSRH